MITLQELNCETSTKWINSCTCTVIVEGDYVILKSVGVTVSCLNIIKHTLRKIVHQTESELREKTNSSSQTLAVLRRERVAPLMAGLMFCNMRIEKKFNL